MVFLVWGDSLLWYLLVAPCAEESSMFGYSIAGLSGTGFSTLVTGCDRPCFHVAARHNLTKPIFTSWSKIQFWLYTCIGLWGSRLPVFLNLLTPDSIGFAEFQHQTGPTGNSRFRMTTTVMGQFLDVTSAGKYCWILSKSIDLISRRFLERIDALTHLFCGYLFLL